MKEAKNELMQFVGGVIMLVVGLYILSQKVMVSSSYGFFSLWGGRFSSGLIMVPLIIELYGCLLQAAHLYLKYLPYYQ